MCDIIKCNNNDYETLAGIWERSVRATHDFLNETDLEEIKAALITDYFPNVDIYVVCNNGNIVGFMGLGADMIEMLFIDSNMIGHGYESLLIDYAKSKGITKVDVNEQNHSALGFLPLERFQNCRTGCDRRCRQTVPDTSSVDIEN